MAHLQQPLDVRISILVLTEPLMKQNPYLTQRLQGNLESLEVKPSGAGRMRCAQVGILEQADQVRLRSFLKRQDG